jgi:thioredoxin 1
MADTLVLTDDNFQAEVLDSTEPVLVDVGAAWCGPCRTLEPIVEQLAEEYAGRVKVAKLDADAHPQTVAKYQIRGLPTLLFFHHGSVQDTHVGVAAKAQLADKLDALSRAA